MNLKQSITFPVILLAVGILFLSNVAPSYGAQSNFLNLVKSYRALDYEAHPSADLPVLREPRETIEVDQMIQLRELLQKQQYDELNKILDKYQQVFEENQTNEYMVYDAFRSFQVTDLETEKHLEEWIKTFPDQYQPYLASANYYYRMGWNSRGNAWAKDTSQKQLRGMKDFFRKAKENAKTALAINPNLMVAYKILIGVYNAMGPDWLEDRTSEKAISLFPHSYLVRSSSVRSKRPRWGGDYREMENIAKEAEQYAKINTELTSLYGLIYIDQGERLEYDKKNTQAIERFTKALTFGENWIFYKERADIYHFEFKNYNKALVDINRSIKLRPTNYESILLRSRIYFAKKNYTDSFEDLATAEKIAPGNNRIDEWKSWASKNLMLTGNKLFKTNPRKAIKNYELSLNINDQNDEVYYWIGVAYDKLNDNAAAQSSIKKAIEINPTQFKYYHALDYLLAKKSQWDEIIRYWNQFLKLEPKHAEAYFERAGTFRHKGDMPNAISDLKKACELGSKEACQIYKEYK